MDDALPQVERRSRGCALAPGTNGVPYSLYKGRFEVSMEAYGDCMEKLNNSVDVASSRWYCHSEGEKQHNHGPVSIYWSPSCGRKDLL